MERLRKLFRLSLLLSVLLTVTTEAWADNGAYAVLSNNTLTFAYGTYTPSSTSCWAVSQSSWSEPDDVPWAASRENITSVIFDSSFSKFKPQSCAYWFYGFNSLESISDINNLDTSQTTDMSYMFYSCISLKSLDVSGFNTSNVTTMNAMFCGCNSLESLDLSGFNTSNVSDMKYMFYSCISLKSLDVSGFNTSNVTTMYSMFCGCNSLESLDLSSFNTSNVTTMHCMFLGCNSLKSLDLSGFNTSKVSDMSYMFYGCNSLRELDLGSFDTSQGTNCVGMFSEVNDNLVIYYKSNAKLDGLTEEINVNNTTYEYTSVIHTQYDLSWATVTLPQASYVYSGSACTPTPEVVSVCKRLNLANNTTPKIIFSRTLEKDVDYTVSYSNNINAGTATVTLQPKTGVHLVNSRSTYFTINRKTVGLTWANTSLTYNGFWQVPTATATGTVNNDAISVTVTGGHTNAGTGYTATASYLTGDNSGNYQLPSSNTQTYSIAAKSLTVTAEAKSKTYGDADPALTYTSSGLFYGDSFTGSLTRASGENAGTYAISQGTLTAGNNYSISYTGANLTINKANLSDVTITGVTPYIDIDQAKTPTFTAKLGSYTLTANDYDMAVQNANAVGTATISLTGKGNFTGTNTTQTFDVTRRVWLNPDYDYLTYYAAEDLEIPSGYTAETITDANLQAGTLTTTGMLAYIPQQTAVILHKTGTAQGTYHLRASTGNAPTVFTGFKGVLEQTAKASLDGDVQYILVGDAFVKMSGGNLAANRCYLAFDNVLNAPARLQFVETEGTTPLTDITTTDAAPRDGWYTLDGRKLNGMPTKKGLYVRDGVKIVIK